MEEGSIETGRQLRIWIAVGGLAVGLAALLWAAPGGPTSALADPIVSVDTVSDGANTATSVGTIDSSLSAACASAFTIDIVIQGVTPFGGGSGGISGFQANLLYDQAVINVESVSYAFLLGNTGATVVDLGETPPDADGNFLMGAITFPLGFASGSGVVARLQLQAVGGGISPLDLVKVKLTDSASNPIPPLTVDGFYAGPVNDGSVTVNCATPTATATPTPTPTVTATPSATATPTPTAGPCGSTPAWPVPFGDADCDGFTDALEGHVGTDPARSCPAQTGEDTWPVDNNLDMVASLADVLAYIGPFNKMVPPAPVRLDLNMDTVISLSDVLTFIPFFNKSCGP